MENWSDLVRINMDWINHAQLEEWLQMFEVAVKMFLLQNVQTHPGFDFLGDVRGNDNAFFLLFVGTFYRGENIVAPAAGSCLSL